ncbi:MAG: PAS domain S-box protein [Candidatus Aquicultorales bacterium]
MEASRTDKPIRSSTIMWLGFLVGLILGLFFLAVDVLVDVYILGRAPTSRNLTNPIEIWVRFFMFLVIIGFCLVYARLMLANKRLEQNEARYGALTEAAHDVIFIVNRDDIVEYVNARAASRFSRRPEDLIGKRRHDLFPPDVAEKEKKNLEQVLASGEPLHVEEPITFPNHIEWQATWLVPLKEKSGRVRAVMGVGRDITERVRAEEALKESEQRFRGISAALGEGVCVLDQNGLLTFMNPEAERLLGYAESELAGRDIHDLIHYQKANGTRIEPEDCSMRRVLAEGTAYYGEELFTRKDGKVFPVSCISTPIKKEGKVVAVVTAFQDIRERKHAAEELEFRSRLLDNATDSVFVLTREGEMLYVNEAAYKTRGYTKEELLAMPLSQLDAPEFREIAKEHIETLLRTGIAVFEAAHLKKDGTVMPVEVHASTITYRGRQVIVSIVRDITRRKKGELTLRRSKELGDALNEINSAINSTLEFEKIMLRVAQDVGAVTGCEATAVNLREDERWVIRYLHGLPSDLVGTRLTREQAKHLSLTAKTKTALVVEDTATDERVDRGCMEMLGIKSFVSVPLILKDEVIGDICFAYLSAASPFTELQVDFVTKVAASVTLAVENARRYEAERIIADTLQEALLTLPEDVAGIEFGHLYRSATEATDVGGDFYDLFEFEHNKVGVTIGDISGKGLEAATLTSLVKNTVKAYAHVDASPASIMAKTNHLVLEASKATTFSSVFFGILDLTKGVLTYCSAGHPPGILKTEHECELLAGGSPIVGALADVRYADEIQVMKPGDALVLYTDGTTEARRNDEFFGEKRLLDYVREIKGAPSKMPERIFEKIQAFTGGRLSDDIALLVIGLRRKR